MPSAAGRILRVVVSFALAGVMLWLFARNLDFERVGASLRGASPSWLAASSLLSVLAIPIRSWRWTLLLRHVGRVTQFDAFSATCIGFAATTLLPARAGEVVRPVALSRRTRLPFAPLLASIALERLIDLVCIITLFVFYALAGFAPAEMGAEAGTRFALLRRSALVAGAGTAAALVFLALLSARPSLRDRLLSPALRLLPARVGDRVGGVLRSFLEGFGSLRTARETLAVACGSAALWLTICAQVWAGLQAFDLRFPFAVSFFVLTWGVLGLAIPTPGGVGGYHAAVAYCLVAFHGVAPPSAAAFALAQHAVSFVPITVLGLGFLAAGGLSLGALRDEPADFPPPATAPDSATPGAR